MEDLSTLLQHIQEESDIRIEALEALLGLIRRLSLQHGIGGVGVHLEPSDVSDAFFNECRELFGPLALDVLRDWGISAPADIGKALGALTGAGLLIWGKDDSPAAYAELPPLPAGWPNPLETATFRESIQWKQLP